MNFKIDTKEKFTTITPLCENIYDNVAEELQALATKIVDSDVKNVIVNFSNVTGVNETAANSIAKLQQSFYEKNASFVVCCMNSAVEDTFEKFELLEVMNTTPTESEAWDIVQMEEIERELLDSDDVEFDVDDNDEV